MSSTPFSLNSAHTPHHPRVHEYKIPAHSKDQLEISHLSAYRHICCKCMKRQTDSLWFFLEKSICNPDVNCNPKIKVKVQVFSSAIKVKAFKKYILLTLLNPGEGSKKKFLKILNFQGVTCFFTGGIVKK